MNYTSTSCRCSLGAVSGYLKKAALGRFCWNDWLSRSFLLGEPISGSAS